ncbi:MAG: hypothetical protein V2A71_00115 [Candidatus Eisenbacteria bacterium]
MISRAGGLPPAAGIEVVMARLKTQRLPVFMAAIALLCLSALVASQGEAAAGDVLRVSACFTLADPTLGNLDAHPTLLLAQKSIRDEAKKEEKISPTDQTPALPKSPSKAFLFSSLMPGSGQLYVGAKRGYVYLGVEAIAWTSSYFLHRSGKDKKEEYEDYADQHWTYPDIGTEYNGYTYTAEVDSLIEYFYAHDKEHYYEDIGKYPVYFPGWDPGTREGYLDLRDDSNRLLKRSGYAMMLAVVNHVASAIDALRLARDYNVKVGHGVELNLKFQGNQHSTGVMLLAHRSF